MAEYGFKFEKTPYDEIISMLRWASERNDAKDRERKNDYMNLMKNIASVIPLSRMHKGKTDLNNPEIKENVSEELVGKTPNELETRARLTVLGLDPNLWRMY